MTHRIAIVAFVAAIASSRPVAAESWHKVKEFKGAAVGKKTETFTIPDNEWRITWKLKKKGYCVISVFSEKDKDPIDAIGGNDTTGDSSVQRGKGRYYLDIVFSEPFEITIETKH